MSLGEFNHRLKKKTSDVVYTTLDNYNLDLQIKNPTIVNDDLIVNYYLKIDAESQPDINGESEYASRTSDEENSVCFPIVESFGTEIESKYIHYSLKNAIYIKRAEKDIISIFNSLIEVVTSIKDSLQMCNDVFTTDVSGTTPMSTISATLTPNLQEITTKLNSIIEDYSQFKG
jgi:hypothetical protein